MFKFYIHLLGSLLFIFVVFSSSSANDWTWCYEKSINVPEAKREKDCFFWTKINNSSFTQLVFSWNALRPDKGYYTFWVRGRGAKSKKWYKWHKMFNWGKDIQESFVSCFKDSTNYYYVRLESPARELLDGFSVQVKAYGGASLLNLKKLYVSLSNFKEFRSELHEVDKLTLKSLNLNCMPLISQMKLDHPDYDSLCSPTSTAMFTGYMLGNSLDAVSFASNVYDSGLKGYGSWSFNTAHAYDISSGKICCSVRRLSGFQDIHESLSLGNPVVVSIRGPLSGAALPHENGHLLLVVGYDQEKKQVICNDPAFPEDDVARVRYNIKDFIKAWERSRRLAYIAHK